MKLTGKILKKVVTEKSTKMEADGKYVFRVSLFTNAGELKNELKKLYGVDVVKTETIILPGKPVRLGKTRLFKKSPKRKKMIVTLKEGQTIKND